MYLPLLKVTMIAGSVSEDREVITSVDHSMLWFSKALLALCSTNSRDTGIGGVSVFRRGGVKQNFGGILMALEASFLL